MKTSKIYDAIIMIKLPKDMKEKFEEKANQKYKNLSEYVRDLIRKELDEN